jgi:hypothetical protein
VDNLPIHLRQSVYSRITGYENVNDAGRLSQDPVVWHKGFLCRAASWKTARRVVARVEFHFGELFPQACPVETPVEILV